MKIRKRSAENKMKGQKMLLIVIGGHGRSCLRPEVGQIEAAASKA